jgi:excisionase family DNA binding protein
MKKIALEVHRLMTLPEFSQATGLSYPLVLKLVSRGDIPSLQIGPRRRIDAQWVKQWLESQQSTTASPISAR